MMVTVIYGVAVWPLVLLVGRVFDRGPKAAPPKRKKIIEVSGAKPE